jgi:hypothetical protein
MLTKWLATFQVVRRFSVQICVPRAVLMLDGPSAEAKSVSQKTFRSRGAESAAIGLDGLDPEFGTRAPDSHPRQGQRRHPRVCVTYPAGLEDCNLLRGNPEE